MSNRAMSWAIDCEGLPLATKAILMLLADCHNGASGICCPKEEWLAEKSGISGRTVRMHIKALEEAKLIERLYTHGGRGVGRQFAGYELKFNLEKPVEKPSNDGEKDRQDNAAAGSCHGKITSLPRQDPAKPYKEEPESNRKSICGKSALEEIWSVWSPIGRKRSNAKKKLVQYLNRMAGTFDLELVVRGCRQFAAETDGKFHPGLQVFLSTGKWENWSTPSKDPDPRGPDPTPEDWAHWREHYQQFGEWIPDDIPLPDDLKPGGQGDLLGDAA